MRSGGGARGAVIPPCFQIPRRQFLMQCPSCGATTKTDDPCIECGHSPELVSSDNHSNVTASTHQARKSTLIEFPGVTRSSVPEWRKELTVRVREVQERRAREAAVKPLRPNASASKRLFPATIGTVTASRGTGG